MSERTDRLLTDGLTKGYASDNPPVEYLRYGFNLKANDYLSPEGGHYHDEWFADDNGGGQEIVRDGEELATRVYAGGIIPIEELLKLCFTTKDVISRLIASVRELGERTRLGNPCHLELSDGWEYSYEILKTSVEVPLTIGYESIRYNGREVCAHGHMISPIR